MLCDKERPSSIGIKHFYKMPVNTLYPPSVIRDSTTSVSRSHIPYDLFPLTITGIYVTNSSRPQRSRVTPRKAFSVIIRQEEGHSSRTTLGSLATEKVKDTAKLR